MAADVVGGILLAGITLYAVLGGADFGGGLWDLLAGGDQRGRAPRALIDESITPVWEANHVWLVFDLVIFWTAFPSAFAAVMTTLALPLWLALAGIVLRGAGFAFRKEIARLSLQRAAGAEEQQPGQQRRGARPGRQAGVAGVGGYLAACDGRRPRCP